MCVVLETPIEGESTTEVVLGICQVFNICVRVCVLMDATRARRSPGTGVWLTSEWRWWRSKQEGGGPEAGGALPTVRDAVVKLYRYVVGDGDEALSTCVVMSLLRIDGSELEHVDTRCCESNCRMISYYFLWSVLTYIWFIYNTTLFISSLNLKKPFTGGSYLTPLSMMFVQTWLTDGLRFACAGKYVSSYFHQLSPAQIKPVGKHWSKNKNLYRETTKTALMSGEMSCKEPTTHIKKLIRSIRYRGLVQLNSTSEVKPLLRLCIFKLSQLYISFLVLLRVK